MSTFPGTVKPGGWSVCESAPQLRMRTSTATVTATRRSVGGDGREIGEVDQGQDQSRARVPSSGRNLMAKITLAESKPRISIEALQAEAKLARKHPTKAERKLQSLINKGPWRWRRKKVWGREVYDLWCSVLYIGIQIVSDPPGPEWRGKATMVLYFSDAEILGEVEMVAQIIEQAAASQHAWLRACHA